MSVFIVQLHTVCVVE